MGYNWLWRLGRLRLWFKFWTPTTRVTKFSIFFLTWCSKSGTSWQSFNLDAFQMRNMEVFQKQKLELLWNSKELVTWQNCREKMPRCHSMKLIDVPFWIWNISWITVSGSRSSWTSMGEGLLCCLVLNYPHFCLESFELQFRNTNGAMFSFLAWHPFCEAIFLVLLAWFRCAHWTEWADCGRLGWGETLGFREAQRFLAIAQWLVTFGSFGDTADTQLLNTR